MITPSRNFVLREWVASRDYPELEIPLEDLGMTMTVNSMRVTLLFMQPARDRSGSIETLSWCRSHELNVAVDGKQDPPSDHLLGLACDFRPRAITAQAFHDAAVRGELAEAGAVWDKLNFYSDRGTFHVALRLAEDEQRMRVYVDWKRIV